MANKMHVKKGDIVVVISGKDRNRENEKKGIIKKGKILKVYPENMTVLVEGINMCKKHKKPRGNQYQQGGIIHQEAPISSSKVKVICSSCGVPTRIRREVLANGDKVRVCVKCNAQISTVEKAEKK